jgi:hypothetical protein
MGLLRDRQEEIYERGFGDTGDRGFSRLHPRCRLRAKAAPHLTGHACTFCGREAAGGVPIAADFGACDGASVGEPMSVY